VSPNGSIKKTVDTQKAEIVTLEEKITVTRGQIEGLTGDAYVQKASEYNALVIDYNVRLVALKESIDTYNTAVRVFNTCAGISGV
jgi:phosphopantetheine adenylyltransferase